MNKRMCAFTVTSTSMALFFSSNVPWKGSSFNWTKSPYQKSGWIINSSIDVMLYPLDLVIYRLVRCSEKKFDGATSDWNKPEISSQLLQTCFNTVLSIFVRCKRFLSVQSYPGTYGISQCQSYKGHWRLRYAKMNIDVSRNIGILSAVG